MTDAELLSVVQAGDLSAWEQLYDRYLPMVWRYVYLRTGGDRHLVDDVVSETFLVLVRRILSLAPGDGNLSGWLIAVAQNKLGDHQRNAARGRQAVNAIANNGSAAAVGGAGATLEAVETRGQVIAVMDDLPDEERVVLEWKYLEDLSVREIAGRLGRTEKAVESVLYRARQSFRSQFNRLNGEDQ